MSAGDRLMSGDRDSRGDARPAGTGSPRRRARPPTTAPALLAAAFLACASPGGDQEQELEIVLQVQGVGAAAAEMVEHTAEAFRTRLDRFGLDGSVAVRPGNRVAVRLPGVDDPERAVRLLSSRASLELRLVRFPEGGLGLASREEVLEHFGGDLPDDLEILDGPQWDDNGRPAAEVYFAVERPPLLTGADLAGARPSETESGDPIVLFGLRPDAAAAFGDATERNIGRNLAIVFDGRVVAAPYIVARISDQGVIQGRFTKQEVRDIAILLNAGALPAQVEVVERRVTGPTHE
jgi:preprotein translocase subunit SecD